MDHKTIPESTRLMLHNLETIEKVLLRKTMRKPMLAWPRLAPPPRKGSVYPARKGREAFRRISPQEGTHRQVL